MNNCVSRETMESEVIARGKLKADDWKNAGCDRLFLAGDSGEIVRRCFSSGHSAVWEMNGHEATYWEQLQCCVKRKFPSKRHISSRSNVPASLSMKDTIWLITSVFFFANSSLLRHIITLHLCNAAQPRQAGLQTSMLSTALEADAWSIRPQVLR